MPDRPSAIIFDFGGVVIGWDPRRIYRRFLASDEEITQFFEEVGFFAWNLEQDRGGPWPEAVETLCRRFPHRRELIQAFDALWEESITGPIEGTVRILHRLNEEGYRLIGLTNWSADKFRLTRPRYELFDLFEEIIVSGEVGCIKPEREIFELTLRRIGLKAEECVFIDDSPKNVEAAAAMGFRAILFSSPEQLERELVRVLATTEKR